MEVMAVLLVVLICMSGFFSGSETGMMSLNRYRLRHLARKKNRNAMRIMRLLERPDRLLGVILIGNTFANVLASAIATVIAAHYFGDLGIAVATILLTLVILIFSEAAPKTFAALHSEKVATIVSLPLRVLLIILYPLVILINGMANAFLGLFRVRVGKRGVEPLSAEELRSVVNEATGKISPSYQQILLQILDLESVTVEDVMVPRNDIYGIDLSREWDKILDQLAVCPHSHVPLYRESIDQVCGILNVRKVLAVMQHKKIDKHDLTQLADKVYFVPEGALLNRQLLNFQDQQRAFGLVVDEYGDIQGLVTLQDILEEIVGEFAADVDETARAISKQKDGSFLVDASMSVRDLVRQTQWKLPIDGPKTLSGLIIEELEIIPKPGISTNIAGYPMQVEKVKNNRVRVVRVWPDKYQRHES